jgi:hypothetical protein
LSVLEKAGIISGLKALRGGVCETPSSEVYVDPRLLDYMA